MNSKAAGRLPLVVKFTCGLEFNALEDLRLSAIKVLVHLTPFGFALYVGRNTVGLPGNSISHAVPPKEEFHKPCSATKRSPCSASYYQHWPLIIVQ